MKTAATKTMARAAAKSSPRRKRAPVEAAAVPLATIAADALPAAKVVAAVAVTAPGKAEKIVSLASNCTVKDAVVLKESLCTFAAAAECVVIEGSAVERVDTAIVQLLVAFVRERLGNDREVAWRSPSVALLDAARLLGVRDLLSLPRAPQPG